MTSRMPHTWAGLLNWSTKYHDATTDSTSHEMSEADKKWLQEAMESGGVAVDEISLMKDLVKNLIDRDSAALQPDDQSDDVDDTCDQLVDIVSQMDRAIDIYRSGQFVHVVSLLHSSNHQLRACAAEIIATCVQNNPEMQQNSMQLSVLERATHLAVFDSSQQVRTKAMYAVSCLVRNFSPGERKFISDGDGLLLLCQGLSMKADLSLPDHVDGIPKFLGPHSQGYRRKCLHLLVHILKGEPSYVDACVTAGLLELLIHHATEGADIDLTETSLQLLHHCIGSSPVAHAAALEPGLDLRSRLRARMAASKAGNNDADGVVTASVTNILSRLGAPPPPPPPTPVPQTSPSTTSLSSALDPGVDPRVEKIIPLKKNKGTQPTPTVRTSSYAVAPNVAPMSDVFVPTHEFQVLSEGQSVPPGLHVKMDMTTGERWAKLCNPAEEVDDAMRSVVVHNSDDPLKVITKSS